jgi:predicted O-methyltransferase YrrM
MLSKGDVGTAAGVSGTVLPEFLNTLVNGKLATVYVDSDQAAEAGWT